MELNDTKGLPGRMGFMGPSVYKVSLLLSASEWEPSREVDPSIKRVQARVPFGSSSVFAGGRCISKV